MAKQPAKKGKNSSAPPPPPAVTILPVDSEVRTEQARELFGEYATYIRRHHGDVCLADFQEEVAGLPGEYVEPAGRLFLAFCESELAGCVALRPLSDKICEIKRLYVRPKLRGKGLGRILVNAVLAEVRRIGYSTIRLDTLSLMKEAQGLYRSLGFTTIKPYLKNHPAGALCLELKLR
jgi:ribosomal protein S18 acetylase RimI-like enzyme